MATVKDIAKLAGVSTATVSRALAEPEKVATATRIKIEKIATQAGYSPNAIARSLRTNETRTIVVIVPDISNSFFAEVIKGIETVAQKNNYKVLVGDSGHDLAHAQKYLELINSKQAEGVLLLSADLPLDAVVKENGEPRFPIVMACEFYEGSSIPSVHIDNEFSSRMAIESLIQMGHQKIATITGPISNPLCKGRLKGYESALENAEIVIHKPWILHGDFSFDSGYRLAGQLLAKDDVPTAVFCQNDEMAIGVLKMAREMSVQVPKQLSVIGFDNISFSEYCTPELTTIHQPRRLMGETAMKLLLDILGDKKPNPEMTLPTQYLVRSSTASPPMMSRNLPK